MFRRNIDSISFVTYHTRICHFLLITVVESKINVARLKPVHLFSFKVVVIIDSNVFPTAPGQFEINLLFLFINMNRKRHTNHDNPDVSQLDAYVWGCGRNGKLGHGDDTPR